jgi:hypothetical protein
LRRDGRKKMTKSEAAFDRYLPLVTWLAVLLTALFICLKVLGYGYIPAGDARRHVAKPFSHRPYSQIVVMRPEYVVDHSPGWEWFLGLLQRGLGWDEDALLSFSVASMALVVFCFPALWLRHPEAWMAAVLAELIAIPELMTRWMQGRPYLLTEGILMALLLSWSKKSGRNVSCWKLAGTCLGFALSVWMHGAWYLWCVLLAAFFLAQRWRESFQLAGCWVVGTVVGALLTGRPLAFLKGAVFMAISIYREHLPKWMLVGEFQPSAGEFGTLVLLAIVYLWARLQNKPGLALARQPVFWMILLNWILGLTADRFWADWGVPAAIVWMAMQFDEGFPNLFDAHPFQRLLACGCILLPLYLDAGNDLGRRYSATLDEPFVDAKDPRLEGWMPGKGGIFYADNMRFFYNTFYKNPQGDWRYILGFEPALMPTNDLAVYRGIQRSHGAPEAYEPWVKKLRPEDRLVVSSDFEPHLPELEWTNAAVEIWIGRLPALKSAAGKRAGP